MISKFINNIIYNNNNTVNTENNSESVKSSKMDIDKRVVINENENKLHYTYSHIEYDRHQILSQITFRKCGLLSDEDLNMILQELNYYKKYEMTIHNESAHNTKFHNYL